MSSSIDYFDCPQCGGNAHREQDNKTCEISYGCSSCDWKGEPVNNEVQSYSKITTGFVTQQYVQKKDKYICIEQFFTASDEVDRENQDGNPVQIDTSKEIYQTLDMEQPVPKKENVDPDPTIQIVIAGGAVQSVIKPAGIALEIRDYDVEGADIENEENYKQDDDGDWYQKMFWDENEIEE